MFNRIFCIFTIVTIAMNIAITIVTTMASSTMITTLHRTVAIIVNLIAATLAANFFLCVSTVFSHRQYYRHAGMLTVNGNFFCHYRGVFGRYGVSIGEDPHFASWLK